MEVTTFTNIINKVTKAVNLKMYLKSEKTERSSLDS
jgi:hypothetical protein